MEKKKMQVEIMEKKKYQKRENREGKWPGSRTRKCKWETNSKIPKQPTSLFVSMRASPVYAFEPLTFFKLLLLYD